MTTGNTSNDADRSNDEVMRKFLKPNPTNKQIIQAISKTYQCDQSHVAILKELESYDDRNYLIQLESKKYLCKVYNGVESFEYIKSSSTLEEHWSAFANEFSSGSHHVSPESNNHETSAKQTRLLLQPLTDRQTSRPISHSES